MNSSNSSAIVDPSYRRQLLYLWQGSKVRFKWAEVISLALGRERNATLLRWQHQGYRLLKNLFRVDRTGELSFAGQWDENGWLEITHQEIRAKSGMKTTYDVRTFLRKFELAGIIERKHLVQLDDEGQPFKRLFIRLRPEGLLQQLNRQDAPELAVVEVPTEKVSTEPRDEFGVTEEIALRATQMIASGEIKPHKCAPSGEKTGVISFLAPIGEKCPNSHSLVELSSSSFSSDIDNSPNNEKTNGVSAGFSFHGEVKLRYLKLAHPGDRQTISLAIPPELLDILDYLTVKRWTPTDWKEKDIRSLLYWFHHPNPVIALTLERVKKWFRLHELSGDLDSCDGNIQEWMWNCGTAFFCRNWGTIWKGIRLAQLRSEEEVMELERYELQPEVLTETAVHDLMTYARLSLGPWGGYQDRNMEEFLAIDFPAMPLHPLSPFILMSGNNPWSDKLAHRFWDRAVRFLINNPRAVDSLRTVKVEVNDWFNRMGVPVPDWKKLKVLADRNWNATRLEMELY